LHYAKSLEEDFPEVAALFSAFQMEGEQLSAMGKAIAVEGQEVADFAQEWVAANEDTVLNWLSN
jgi:glycine betaine/proline transport system substrate-binding protein